MIFYSIKTLIKRQFLIVKIVLHQKILFVSITQHPPTKNSPLNTPNPSPTRNVLWKTPLPPLRPSPYIPIYLPSWISWISLPSRFCTQTIISTAIIIPLSSTISPSPIFSHTFQELQQLESGLKNMPVATAQRSDDHLTFLRHHPPIIE